MAWWWLLLLACSGSDDGGPTPDDTALVDSAAGASATVLLVVDPSDSMVRSAQSLALGLDGLLASLPVGTEVAVTTTDVEALGGDLVGPPTTDAEALAAQILCDATCFRSDGPVPPSDPGHTCGDPLGAEVTSEWLDCACGVDAWQDRCGTATEEGLEAIWLATCRADAVAPANCFDGVLAPVDAGSIELGAQVHAVVISDEGDGSRRQEQEADAVRYTDLFASATRQVTVSVVVPGLAAGSVACPGVATDWGVLRYFDAANRTGGDIADIFDDACVPADAAAAVQGLLD